MTNIGILNEHIVATHKGIKYPCGQCLYQATSKSHQE